MIVSVVLLRIAIQSPKLTTCIGVDISKGKRKMIVCFMDGFNPDIHDDSLECDDRKEYEEIVIKT